MDIFKLCNICLKNNTFLRNICEIDSNNIKWSDKLSVCVPEADWLENYSICQLCIIQLEAAYAFRNLCLQSVGQRRKYQTTFLKNEFMDLLQNKHQSQDFSIKINDNTQRFDNLNLSNLAKLEYEHGTIPYDYCIPKYEAVNHIEHFICFHCNNSYNSKLLLISHIQQEHEKKLPRNECHLCKSLHISRTMLRNHLNQKHGITIAKLRKKSKKYKCEKCHRMYATEGARKMHFKQCDGIKRHSVKIGVDNGNIFDTTVENLVQSSPKVEELREIKLRVFENVKIEEAVYPQDAITHEDYDNESNPMNKKRNPRRSGQQSKVCQICGMQFNTQYLAKRHMHNVHATEKNFKCDICDQKFVSSVYLKAHQRYHTNERTHVCLFCGKAFITGSDLYHHEKIHANKRAYRCEKCPKAFNTSSDLHKHKLCVHQDRSQWKHVCAICNRRFPLKTNLDAHTKIHTGERNFACHFCDRRCINRSVLLRHIKTHSNIRLYKCVVCNLEYKYQKSLDIHMAKAHGIGDAKIPIRIKKYFCHMCPKSYFANNKLQKHIRTHTGERPFSCEICGKRFIDKCYVKQHLKTAHSISFTAVE